nr:nuclear cap-binding protein subunit 3-like isoform X1 [Ciona intestinalis]|eukprot:XP_009860207.1 nuclear cap-binding protein subunit 3-like isoform X1 [Ciona intestinalis]
MEVDNTTDKEKNEKDNEEKKNPGPNPLLPCKESFEKSGQKMTLEIRYAELRDRKVLGAAKRSKYYINHGNPNYGGTKGLLSSAFRKRYQMSHARNELMNMNVPITNSRRDNNDDSGDSNHYRGKWSRRNKMRSDDVEEEDGKSKEELEDDQLMKSSAKDLTDAIPVNDSGDDSDGFGTMVADQVAKTVKEAREMKERGNFHLQVTTSNSNIRSRLGKRSHSSVSRDKNVLDRLPTALRNRLGNKRSKDSSQDNNSFRSRDRYHDHRNHSHRDSEKFKRVKEEKDNSSPITRTIKSGRESRSLKRYSPTPWDSSDEDLDMF